MELSNGDFQMLRDYIRKACGISLSREKKYLVVQRLKPLVLSSGCANFNQFCRLLMQNSASRLRDEIILAITTNETSFFRDRHPFEAFSGLILPKLGKQYVAGKISGEKEEDEKIRILSIGASTGQEPYTIAILVYEYVKSHRHIGATIDDFEISAFDVSTKALEKAMKGVYTEIEMERGLSPERASAYFKKTGNKWTLDKSIRNMVRFSKTNLMESYTMPAGVFHVIFCRNVLIYFDDETKSRVFDKMHRMLSKDGYLILGSMENTYNITNKFKSQRHRETLLFVRND